MSGPDYTFHRPLPAYGIFALLADGHDVSVVAKALDVPCAVVKAYADHAVRDLASVHGVALEPTKRLYHTVCPYVAATLQTAGHSSWMNVLPSAAALEVIETQSYFRAFLNSTVMEN